MPDSAETSGRSTSDIYRTSSSCPSPRNESPSRDVEHLNLKRDDIVININPTFDHGVATSDPDQSNRNITESVSASSDSDVRCYY